ncbi:hypothetical protein [Paraflavitalea speifideaquila]|uniref:hypothetical protein n=1 Tax=Paraflavitalea speifideaquila TaxID=3076558 RepID=UPI0028EAE072|nr:hypothetical protein [Paraflavitalea speifideiaquila]
MWPALIKLSYRQLINHHTTGDFAQKVFEDSYSELQLQAQRYNKDNQLTSFQAITAHDPKANSLHYKVGFAIGLYIQELNGLIPDLWDVQQLIAIPFSTHQFEIVDSHFIDKREHVVAITYTTNALVYLGNVGDQMILSFDEPAKAAPGTWMNTFHLPLQPGLSISGYCNL